MRFSILTLILTLMSLLGQSQTLKPIRWTISLSKTDVKQGEIIEIIMKADITNEWYLYSSDFSPELGPTVSEASFEINGTFKPVGKLIPIGAKEKYDSLWGGNIRYFVKHAEFRQRIKILKTNPSVKGLLSYQVCSDKEGKCIPYEETLSFQNIKVEVTAVPVIDPKDLPEKTEKASNDSEKLATVTTKPSLSLEQLEAEKQKLIKVDSKGEDIVVKELKEFTQKYGGGK